MAVIVVRNFGGIVPAMSQRALPQDNATQNKALLATAREFRPLLTNVAYASALSVSSPKSIYRMGLTSGGLPNTNPATGWIAKAAITNFVPWPRNDVNTERTSVTDGAGAYAPRVIDNQGADRLLGVPPPVKPVVTLNVGSYFTEQARINAIATQRADVISALRNSLIEKKLGAVYTNNATPGFLENGLETAPPALVLTRYRVHRYSGFEGTIVDAYTAAVEADVAWLRATGLATWIQATGTPAYMGASGTWHLALSYFAYGSGFELNSAAATTALAAVTYLTAGQRAELLSRGTDLFSATAPGAAAVIQPLKLAVAELERIIDTRPPGSLTSAASTTSVDAAREACARQIYAAISFYGGTFTSGAGA